VLFVGHLSDRMLSPQTVRDAVVSLVPAAHRRCRSHANVISTRIGLYADKVDGKAGMKTPRGARSVPEIGWAEGGLLAERSGAAFDQRGRGLTRIPQKHALGLDPRGGYRFLRSEYAHAKRKKPGRRFGRVSDFKTRRRKFRAPQSDQSQT